MIQFERFNRVLKLSVLFSFFLYMLSFILTIFVINLEIMLINTFLSTFIDVASLFLLLIFKILKYVSVLFFVGSIIGLISIFIQDMLIKPTRDF